MLRCFYYISIYFPRVQWCEYNLIIHIIRKNYFYRYRLLKELLNFKLQRLTTCFSLLIMTLFSSFLRATYEVLDSSIWLVFAQFDCIVRFGSYGFAGDAPFDKWTNHFYSIQFCAIKCASDSILATSWFFRRLLNTRRLTKQTAIAVTPQTCIQEVRDSNLSRDTSYPMVFMVFLSSSRRIPG
jgi:hypothetical protein